MKNLSEKELKTVQDLVAEFNQAKIQLGDTVISQNALMTKVAELKVSYAKQEEKLIKKYGKDSVINIQTGEVTTEEKTAPEMTPVK
jgi:hypothetical protein|tara:strand:- start:375 stop:632 length:258 start_codon:yes stop_codon:yes gene_type:complete